MISCYRRPVGMTQTANNKFSYPRTAAHFRSVRWPSSWLDTFAALPHSITICVWISSAVSGLFRYFSRVVFAPCLWWNLSETTTHYTFSMWAIRVERKWKSSFSCSDEVQRKNFDFSRENVTQIQVEFELFIFPHPQSPSEHLTEHGSCSKYIKIWEMCAIFVRGRMKKKWGELKDRQFTVLSTSKRLKLSQKQREHMTSAMHDDVTCYQTENLV